MNTPRAERSRPLVLIADHHEEIRDVLSIILAGEGYETAEAASGSETLRLAREINPDVILLEITMRDIDGYEVLRTLKSDPATKGIAVIVISGLSRTEDRQLSLSLGAEQHISKPWATREIEAVVARALAGRQ